MTRDQMNAAVDTAAAEHIKALFETFHSSTIQNDSTAFDRLKTGLAAVNASHLKVREAIEKITGKTS